VSSGVIAGVIVGFDAHFAANTWHARGESSLYAVFIGEVVHGHQRDPENVKEGMVFGKANAR
jgi:hypothetical protein